MRIETNRLVIRNVEIEDKSQYFKLYNSEFVLKYNCLYSKTLEQIEKFISDHMKDDNVLAVTSKENELLIGMIYLEEDSLRYMVDSIEISFWIGEEYSNKGFMTEGVGEVVDYLLNNGVYKIITARVFSENVFSRALLEKLKFKQEGVLKSAIKNPQGIIFDDVLYARFCE